MYDLLQKKSVQIIDRYIKKIYKNKSIIILKETARTANDAANSLGVNVGAIVKSLLFKTIIDNKFYLCLISGDKILSIQKFSNTKFIYSWRISV